MGLFGSIDEVLEFAIDREIEANQLYNDLAQRTENVVMKKVFEDFAKEELGHKAKLEAMKANRTTMPTEKVTDLKIADYVVDVASQPDMDYRDALMSNRFFQDFQVKLCEFCFKPSIVRWAYWAVGFIFGFFSRLRGRRAVLRTGIWVETKAVHHYAELLSAIDWDNDTRKVIEKNQSDEYGHIQRWKKLLESSK